MQKMSSRTDRDLVRQARQGNAEAYGELVQNYQSLVFNVCYRLLDERREAEDLTQETFLRAYQHLEQYDPERPFGAWIRRVATNLCINHYRLLEQVDLPLDEELRGPLPGSPMTPELILVKAEKSEQVREAIRSLPPVYRVVIELRHFQDLSYTEIADQLDLPVSDVKSHLFRARRLLAEKLRTYG
jgi:RNA polymerase sigma-70 factor (ECF subfamily)